MRTVKLVPGEKVQNYKNLLAGYYHCSSRRSLTDFVYNYSKHMLNSINENGHKRELEAWLNATSLQTWESKRVEH